MKTKMTRGLLVLLTAALVFASAGCSDSSGGSGSAVNPEDLNPNLTVTTDPAGIADFKAEKGYTAATKEQAEQLIDDLMGDLEGMAGGIAFSKRAGTFARASKTENFLVYFSEDEDLKNELGPYAKINGFAKGLVIYDEDNPDYFSLNNGQAKVRIEFQDDPYAEDFDVIGVIAGEGTANNVVITETSEKGTVKGNVNFAVNIADVNKKVWVKCIININMDVNLSESGGVSVFYDIKAYGNDNQNLFTVNDKQTINLEDFFE